MYSPCQEGKTMGSGHGVGHAGYGARNEAMGSGTLATERGTSDSQRA
ncbi:MAG: hypothetical protein LBR33_07390 [Propionibacteriaceae bacterium]|nr:hypothetical protein [Propionibacteriaceae bacterium]